MSVVQQRLFKENTTDNDCIIYLQSDSQDLSNGLIQIADSWESAGQNILMEKDYCLEEKNDFNPVTAKGYGKLIITNQKQSSIYLMHLFYH